MERINGGDNLKEIRLLLAYQEAKSKEELDKQNQNNIKLQGEQNQKLEQIKSQAAQQAMAMEEKSKRQDFLDQVLIDYLKSDVAAASQFVSQITGIQYKPQEPQQGNTAPQNAPNGQGGGNMPPQEQMAQNA